MGIIVLNWVRSAATNCWWGKLGRGAKTIHGPWDEMDDAARSKYPWEGMITQNDMGGNDYRRDDTEDTHSREGGRHHEAMRAAWEFMLMFCERSEDDCIHDRIEGGTCPTLTASAGGF